MRHIQYLPFPGFPQIFRRSRRVRHQQREQQQ